ncbi:putative endonuclease/exonuclease/phosphatase family protein [Burkholderia ambifaria IOP40-10]|uniref:Putative endonuclease/exonuclease/phosphatase family protein n=1 Tax=Burkholderia ambifaria IOP40-10 TaxID=396596 RepID=B1FQA7_9BURK|nr:putative endonuclease/exonuclease/phosphatase family protein [Burkholderia ambifaria IOP40-10]
MLGALLHGGGDLLHAGGRLFDAARLRRDPRGDVAAAGRDADRAVRDVGRAVAHLRDDAREAVTDPVDRLHEPADLVVARAAVRGRAVADAHAEVARRIALGGPCGGFQRPAHDAAHDDDEQRRERRDEQGADHQEAVAGGAHGGEQLVVERDAADEPLPLRNRRERHEFRGGAAIVRGRVGRRVREPALAGREHLCIGGALVVGGLAGRIGVHDEGAARRALRRIEHEVVAVVADFQRADAVFDELELGADVETDEQRADHAAGCVGHRLVLRDVRPAEQLREARVAAAGDERRIRGAGAVELRADGACAVLLLQRCRDAHEIVAVAREDRRDRAAFLQELVGNRVIEVERLAAREEGRRGNAADVDRARRVEREIGRQEAREQRHRAVGLGGQRLVEQVDHCADRLLLVDDPQVRFFSKLLAGEMGERPREHGKQQGDERARQRGQTRADAHPAQMGQSHEAS